MMSNNTSKSKAGAGVPSILDTINLVSSDSDEDDVMIEDPSPLYKLVFKERSEALLKEVKELHSKKHAKYVETLDKLKLVQNDELIKNNVKTELECEAVETEYEKAYQQIKKETDKHSQEIFEKLIAELNDKKKNILTEKQFMELELDFVNEIPSSSRKLRRRPYDPIISVPQEKRRRLPPLTNNYYLLQELEVEEDVKAITESLDSEVSTSKPELHLSSLTDMDPPKINDSETSCSNVRIESGKLLYDKIWYHRGQPIFVEETPMEKFPAIIISIGKEIIWVKKTLDNSKFRINLSCLSNGKISITRRAAL